MSEEHVTVLHGRLEDVAKLHASVGDSSDFDELFRIIHWPGWTTPVEIMLINSLVDAVERSAHNTLKARQALVEGARAIAESSSK